MQTYIVVADASRARLFTRDGERLVEQEDLQHPEGRLHEGDLVTDRGADVHESTATTARSTHETAKAKKHETEMFARRVADLLYQKRVENRLETLILVAPPHFLGLLRGKLDNSTNRLVSHTLSKDFAHSRAEEIGAAVAQLGRR